MKPLFNDHSLRALNRIALPIVIGMSISTAFLPFFRSTSIEYPQIGTASFYDLYSLGVLFGLKVDSNNRGSMKKVMHEVFTPVSHHLKAIYSDGSNAFVAVSDGTETTFVDYGSLYKNLYRLVRITPDSAVFSAYGNKMTLRLGEEGNLSIKETVSTYVPDTTAPVSSFVIESSMLERYGKNMGETLKKIAIDKVVEHDKITGFKVVKIEEGTPFSLLGLQKGDIVTSIDNTPLNSYATAIAAYHAGLRRSAIKITVLRNNQTKDLEYEISR